MKDAEYFIEIAISSLSDATVSNSEFDDIESELSEYFPDIGYTDSITGNSRNQGWTVYNTVENFSSPLTEVSQKYPDLIFLVKAYGNDCVSFVYFKNGKFALCDLPFNEPALSIADLIFQE